jgi:hypothetical protein
VPDVECRVGKGSAVLDGGAWNVIEGSKAGPMGVEECLSSEAAIHVEHHRMGRDVQRLR